MTNKTILIIGLSGPQGKTTLKRALKHKGYLVLEANDLTWVNTYFNNGYEAYQNGLKEGFIVINFTDKPFIKPKPNYVLPDKELQTYIDYIEKTSTKPTKAHPTSSLDSNQKIYITERSREELFTRIYREEKQLSKIESETKNASELLKDLYRFMFSAEILENYCIGKTYLADSAYSAISKLLKKEYTDWKTKFI